MKPLLTRLKQDLIIWCLRRTKWTFPTVRTSIFGSRTPNPQLVVSLDGKGGSMTLIAWRTDEDLSIGTAYYRALDFAKSVKRQIGVVAFIDEAFGKIEWTTCTICTPGRDCDGFADRCVIREGLTDSEWSCDGTGRLSKIKD